MARLGGFEPPTFRFVAECSIQLSYSRVMQCFFRYCGPELLDSEPGNIRESAHYPGPRRGRQTLIKAFAGKYTVTCTGCPLASLVQIGRRERDCAVHPAPHPTLRFGLRAFGAPRQIAPGECCSALPGPHPPLRFGLRAFGARDKSLPAMCSNPMVISRVRIRLQSEPSTIQALASLV